MFKKLMFLVLFPVSIYSQNIIASYNFQVLSDKEVLKSEYFGAEFTKCIDGAKYLNFELITNDSISLFKANDYLDSDNNEISAAIDYSGFRKNVYSSKGFNYFLNTEIFCPDDKYLIKKDILNNWTLTNETKKIDGYLCYKATTVLVTEVKFLKETFRFPVTAWYCPKIPSKFGPAGYGMLPGLILELQENLKVFTIKRIEFLKKPNIINLPKKGVLISEYDYNELIYKYLKEDTGN